MTDKSTYSSRLGAILTMVGVAVGLGNVWRFPYMMGSYGGSAFLCVYLLFTLFLAYPALLTEMMLGKYTGRGTIHAFEFLFSGRPGKIIGLFFAGVVTIAGSYYAVVVGNVFFSAAFSVFEGFSSHQNQHFQELLGTGLIQYCITLGLILCALLTSYLGLKNGIERISRIIMPFFLVSILYMIFHVAMMPGAVEALIAFLTPNFDVIGSTEIFAALGQAFFSVGLGGTFVVVYAAYIKDEHQIPRIALLTCLGDLGSSLMVSMFLVPSILVFNLPMDAGPSLIFNTLPELFVQLPSGRWVGSLFLVSLSLVAFLSLIAAFQVAIFSISIYKLSKIKVYIGFGVLQLFLVLPSAFYPDIIGVLDLIFGSGMQVLGSMLAVIGVWWGVRSGFFRNRLIDASLSVNPSLILIWLHWVLPITLLMVLIGYIYNSI